MEVDIGNISQIPAGEGRNFVVSGPAGGLRVAVFHTRGGAVFATQADCPHRGGPLADGLIDEQTVVCPLHDRIYAFADGAGLGNECRITVYRTRLGTDGAIVLSTEPVGETVAAG